MKLNGAHTAIVTPFNSENKLDIDVLHQLLEYQIAGSISGIVPCGTTGESPTLSPEEKQKIILEVIDHCKGKCKVIAGTGTYNTRTTISNSIWAGENGADVVMVITPYYNKPGQKGLYLHFSKVATAIAPIPLIIYNVPSRTNVHIESETVLRLRQDHKNIIGIKDASGDMSYVLELVDRADDDFNILCGEDGILMPYLSSGSKGVVSVASNVFPREMRDLVNLYQAGKVEEALKIQLKFRELMNLLFVETNPIPVKYALESIGFSVGSPRLPLHILSNHYQKTLRSAIDKVLTKNK
jgi:4-hydroxy-tetrahydrodipicolinate synthase